MSTVGEHAGAGTVSLQWPSPQKAAARRRTSVIPGFGLTLGLTLTWLALIVLTAAYLAALATFILGARRHFAQESRPFAATSPRPIRPSSIGSPR